MKKAIKDMTKAEKRLRANHLSYKFYDINMRPSTILWDEMQHAPKDPQLQNKLKQLESLEVQMCELEDQYSNTVTTRVLPLKRVFEYELDKLAEKQAAEAYQHEHSFNPIHKFESRSLQDKHQQEYEDLKRDQQARKEQITRDAKAKIQACRKQMYAVFMDAVHYMYR